MRCEDVTSGMGFQGMIVGRNSVEAGQELPSLEAYCAAERLTAQYATNGPLLRPTGPVTPSMRVKNLLIFCHRRHHGLDLRVGRVVRILRWRVAAELQQARHQQKPRLGGGEVRARNLELVQIRKPLRRVAADLDHRDAA